MKTYAFLCLAVMASSGCQSSPGVTKYKGKWSRYDRESFHTSFSEKDKLHTLNLIAPNAETYQDRMMASHGAIYDFIREGWPASSDGTP